MTQPLTMTYRNWRGEIAERSIAPSRIWYGTTEWHPAPGWMLTARDCDKDELRDFALADCQFADLVPAPAVPDDVAEPWRMMLRQAEDDLRKAHATIEAQAADLARLREALQPFASAWRIAQASGLTSMVQLGTLARNEVYAVAFMKAAALTHPTGEPT